MMSLAFLSAWQETHNETVAIVFSLTLVSVLVVRISWQLWQPMATAEWTWAPLALSAWHSRHLASSVLLSNGTGCSFAIVGMARTPNTATKLAAVFAKRGDRTLTFASTQLLKRQQGLRRCACGFCQRLPLISSAPPCFAGSPYSGGRLDTTGTCNEILLGQAQIVYTCGKTKRQFPNWNFLRVMRLSRRQER